jgi:CheY-like chemotaxis protein
LQVEAVYTAQEGIDRLSAEPFDLLITDLMMPRMNGIEMLEVLQDRGIRVPILMITGYPTIRTAVKAMRLGAMDYIAKPFRRKELLGPVKRALRLEAEASTVAEASSETEAPAETEAPGEAKASTEAGKAAEAGAAAEAQGANGEAPSGSAAPSGERRAAADEQPLHPDSLQPGQRVVLPHHAWAEYQQDGTFLIGLEGSFLRATGPVSAAEAPQEMDMVEQGYIGIRLTAKDGDIHGVAMPLSGQVTAVNEEALQQTDELDSRQWLLRIIPSELDSELEILTTRT